MAVINGILEMIIAITTVISIFMGIEKSTKGKITKAINKPIMDKLDKITEEQKKEKLDLLRLVIMSTEMPIEERLDAGEEYVRAGGNAQVKAKYLILKEHYENQMRQEADKE